MKKIFISQPMKGRTDKEILTEREKAIADAADLLSDTVEPIDSYFPDAADSDHPLWHLGASLQKMSEADVAFFAAGWQNARGCKIEHECAVQYGIPTIYSP